MYQVYVLCCGEKDTTRSQFLYRDASQDVCTIAFYFWLVIGPDGPIVIDCTFGPDEARRRGVRDYRDRTALLAACGVKPGDVKQVFMTHLHYDHWAGYDLFPNATFSIQRREIEFWRGDGGRFALFNSSASMEAIAALAPLTDAGRIRVVDGDWRVVDGLDAHLLGGHTPGLQTLSVTGDKGDVLIASDTFHFYENLSAKKPVQVTVNMQQALVAMERVTDLSRGNPDLALPGHDPLVMQRYAQIAPGVVRVC
jgi:glyoxylase-like metal-dependent hydrolase (beta-lactamase superfamily II)